MRNVVDVRMQIGPNVGAQNRAWTTAATDVLISIVCRTTRTAPTGLAEALGLAEMHFKCTSHCHGPGYRTHCNPPLVLSRRHAVLRSRKPSFQNGKRTAYSHCPSDTQNPVTSL